MIFYGQTDEQMTIYLYVREVFDFCVDFHENSVEVRFKTKDSSDPNITYVWRKSLQ